MIQFNDESDFEKSEASPEGSSAPEGQPKPDAPASSDPAPAVPPSEPSFSSPAESQPSSEPTPFQAEPQSEPTQVEEADTGLDSGMNRLADPQTMLGSVEPPVFEEPIEEEEVDPGPDLMAVLAELGEEELTGESFSRLAQAAYDDEDTARAFRNIVEDWGSLEIENSTNSAILKGYGLYLLGQLDQAASLLSAEATKNPWAAYYQSRSLLMSQKSDSAFEVAQEASKNFPDSLNLTYLVIETASKIGELETAKTLLDSLEAKGLVESSEFLYHLGYYQERNSEYQDAISTYRRAVETDDTNTNAAFRLGFCLDLYGGGENKDIDEAISAYEKCLKVVPPHVNAVINLGILYEDRERYFDAIKCFEAVLMMYPNHARARLFLQDSRASTNMFYDKEEEKKADRHNQVLKIPVTDFELSVRSRNCLSKMNILTLGDLIMKSEQELLSYKNFGETSLKEIKEMLTQKGLRLGQGLESSGPQKTDDPRNPLEATASPELLDKSIDFLELSVRSRRCMERLGIASLRDLINKTEVQLMAAKNFGMTSLNEIKRKLSDNSLKLRGS